MRQPKPFFRKYTRSWYVQIGGKHIPLGKDREQAYTTYHQLIGRPETVDFSRRPFRGC